ncbi:MAG: hypothetical protein C4K47_00540 [Candidatus Thorarchaeota archaeon]|nr:MAG: hypothetical protein C4K47_00540 [Candidatus Thorarchaeota archaeon]
MGSSISIEDYTGQDGWLLKREPATVGFLVVIFLFGLLIGFLGFRFLFRMLNPGDLFVTGVV